MISSLIEFALLYSKIYAVGIIQRQALRNTVINFVGAGFGAISRMAMPIVLTEWQVGLLGLLDSISGFFVTIFSMGFEQVLAMLFPLYRNEESGHHGFLMFGILLSLLGTCFAGIIYYFFGDLFIGADDPGAVYFHSFAILIFPLILFRILFRNIDGYARMLFNTVIGVFLEGFITKVLLIAGLMAFAVSWIDLSYLMYFYAFNLSLPGIIVLIYALIKTKKISMPDRAIYARAERSRLSSYIVFGMLTGASLSVVFYVDSLMVTRMISVEAFGIYSILYFAARILVIPSRGISRISAVVLAESWKKNDLQNIREVYTKSCLNQLLIGAFLLGVGWACIGPAMSLTPKYASYLDHVYVFLFLGIGLVVEMATGVNAAIISTSKKYRFETYFNLALAVLIIVFNYFLIKLYALEGAAIASMMAMIVINFLRWTFLVKTYQFQPFDGRFLKALILSVVFVTGCHFLRYEMNPWLTILLNGVGLTFLFWGTVIALKLSPDINQWLLKMKNKFF